MPARENVRGEEQVRGHACHANSVKDVHIVGAARCCDRTAWDLRNVFEDYRARVGGGGGDAGVAGGGDGAGRGL